MYLTIGLFGYLIIRAKRRMANPTLKTEKRDVLGRKVKRLRREGILPANVYGKKVKSQALQVTLADFKKVFSEVGETGLVDLKTSAKGGSASGRNGQTRPVLIHNVQLDPVTDEPLHADFLQVDLKEKVTATVPIEFRGEAPAEKQGVGIVVEQITEVEVEALPTDLPDQITVDISGLEKVDDAIHVKDLNVDRSKVELKEDPEGIVVNVAPPAKEEVAPPPEEVPGAEAEAAEAAEGEAPAEEAAPAEGGEKKAEGKPAEGEQAKKTPEPQGEKSTEEKSG